MDIVKIPKKFREILDSLRNGMIEEGLIQMESIKGLAPQKAIVKAEINYFLSNYEEAMAQDESALLFDEQWYAGNIVTEHFFAYTNAGAYSSSSYDFVVVR